MPAWRAPGTSVSPSASSVAACAAVNVRNGTPCARAAPGVSNTSTPPTVKASAPIAAPFTKARRSMSCMVSSLVPVQAPLLWTRSGARGPPKRGRRKRPPSFFELLQNSTPISDLNQAVRAHVGRDHARGDAGGGPVKSARFSSFHFSAEQPLGVAVGDASGLLLGKLREPAAIGLHDGVVAEPTLVDPGVGAEQEAVGMPGEELAPFARELAIARGDAAAVGELAHQRGIALEQFAHPRRRRRKTGMGPDDPGLGIVPE